MSIMPKPKARTVAKVIREIEAAKKRLAAERDKLRDLHDEIGGLLESCGDADDQLQRALDSLSEYV